MWLLSDPISVSPVFSYFFVHAKHICTSRTLHMLFPLQRIPLPWVFKCHLLNHPTLVPINFQRGWVSTEDLTGVDSIYDGSPCVRELAHILRELLYLVAFHGTDLMIWRSQGTLVTIKQGPFTPSLFCIRMNLNIENKMQSVSEYFNAALSIENIGSIKAWVFLAHKKNW